MKEASKAMNRRMGKSRYQEYFTGVGIDVGCGDDCIIQFNGSFPISSCIKYDLVQGNAELCSNLDDQTFDFLHSSHCLEHLCGLERGVKNWIRIVKVDGYLIITVPDETMYEKNIFPSQFNDDHKWTFRCNTENDSPSSVEINRFFEKFKNVEIVSIIRITDNYQDVPYDMTMDTTVPVECAIEVVLKKISHK